ncbi:MAG TPA: hypothetical protein VFT98_15885 [Myxococcota bacterium]|nr:hypothetical protein [Myxococcota bacterium]
MMRAGHDEELATLRARVERQERELRVAVADLGHVTSRSIDPAHWIRDYPWPCVVGAFSLGLWLGARASRG